MREHLQDDLTIYSAELQQIWQTPEHNTILARGCSTVILTLPMCKPSHPPGLFVSNATTNAAEQNLSLFRHFRVWYHQWQVLTPYY